MDILKNAHPLNPSHLETAIRYIILHLVMKNWNSILIESSNYVVS